MKTDPSLKEVVEGWWQWPKSLLPLVVLYSPLLRLRFRFALTKVADKVNEICQGVILDKPSEAPNALAVAIESQRRIAFPVGVVYVCDCESRQDTEGHVLFWETAFGPGYAVVMLPRNEKSPYSTIDVTTKEVLKLLLVPESFGSVFSEKVVDFLKEKYGKQQSLK